MAQTITDYSAFLTDAREAVEELAGLCIKGEKWQEL